jgi:hypothetical protein
VRFGEIATGDEKVTCCQPDALSPVNVAVAKSAPELDHKCPTWVPVFVMAL